MQTIRTVGTISSVWLLALSSVSRAYLAYTTAPSKAFTASAARTPPCARRYGESRTLSTRLTLSTRCSRPSPESAPPSRLCATAANTFANSPATTPTSESPKPPQASSRSLASSTPRKSSSLPTPPNNPLLLSRSSSTLPSTSTPAPSNCYSATSRSPHLPAL